MFNVGEHTAVGGVISVGPGGGEFLEGLRLRGRRRFGEAIAMEMEGGILRTADAGTGPSLGARMVYRDVGGVVLRWDGLSPASAGENGTETVDWMHAVRAGIAVNSRTAIFSSLAVALLAAVGGFLYGQALGA
jgi:hypothetical protein